MKEIDDFSNKQKDAGDDTEKASANWTELLGVLREASSSFTELGDTIGGTVGTLLTSIGTLSSSVLSVAQGISAAATAVSSLEKASAILAVISAVIQVVSFFTNAAKENEEANLASARATMEYTQALKDLADAKRLAASETIFGTDELEQAYTYNKILEERANSIKDALSDYIESIQQIIKVTNEENGLHFNYEQPPDLLGGDFGDILYPDMLKITSDMRSGWQKFWNTGKDNIHEFDLSRIVDEYGKPDEDAMEDLREWYESYGEGLGESHRIMVEGLINDWDAYKEALEGIKDFSTQLFGDVASDVADAILSGTDNLEEDMDDILLNVKQKVAKAMLENLILTDVFNDELQQKIIDAISSGDISLANQLFEQGMDDLRELLPEYQKFAESVGAIDSTNTSSFDSNNTVMSGVSQESFDVFTGTLMNMQTHTFSINKNVMSIASNSDTITRVLTDISGDTNLLRSISSNISSLKTSVLDIISKGIKVK